MMSRSRLQRAGDERPRRCPVCSGTARRVLFHQEFRCLSSGSILDGYGVVLCGECGLGYADGIPQQDAFDTYYREMSKYEHPARRGQESPYDAARYRASGEVIRRFLPGPQARILEIGCATGGLLSLLKEGGYPNVVGVDPSPACAEAARRLHGISVLCGSVASVSLARESFDFVVLVGVAEHLRDLGGALARIRGLLAPDGMVYVDVPDVLEFTKWPDAPFQHFSIEHINFFSPVSLANLMHCHRMADVCCEQGSCELGCDTIHPVIRAVFRRDDSLGASLVRDRDTEDALVRYIEYSQQLEGDVRGRIDSATAAGNPIIVWGVGTHTLRALSTTSLGQARIAAFVDSNPRYHGKDLNGVPIIAPCDLIGRSEPILVSSRTAQREIVRQIREDLMLNNPLVLLYDL